MQKKRLWIIALICQIANNFAYANVVGYTGPGVAIDHQDTPYVFYSVVARIFIADPEILVLPTGGYIASHDLAGEDSDVNTTLFISTDKGANWQSFGNFTNLSNTSFFLHDDALWIFGKSGGKLTMQKSTDNGTNWTASVTTKGGPFTPHNPAVWGGRLWCTGKTAAISAAEGSDLLLSDSWVKSNDIISTNHPEWRSEGESIEESQVLASPTYGINLLARVNDHSYGALFRVATNGTAITFDSNNDFVALPGGDKKFGATYDAESDKFIVISNPILPGDYRSDIAPNMIRNTAAVITSRDMRNWKVEKIFLHSNDIERDGFGYHNFDFDGDDLVTVARTAFQIPGTTNPRRAHDSNLITFHRIPDFRNLVPDQYLTCSGNQVLRYERTQYQDALLGSFALGTVLSSPDSLGQDAKGQVYVHESGGRVLCFDATGNFLHFTNATPVTLQSSDMDVSQPTDGDATWTKSGGGDWFECTNWYYWGRADTDEEVATFGSALQTDCTITVNETYTLKGFRFLTDHTCLFSGGGSISLTASSGPGLLEVQQGSHQIDIPVTLNNSVLFSAQTNTALLISQSVNLNGQTLTVSGPGELEMKGSSFTLNGGSLVVGGSVTLTNTDSFFNGTVQFTAQQGLVINAGDSFHIVDGQIAESTFDQIVLPELKEGLGWDTSTLYSNGNVTAVLKVPEQWMAGYGLKTDGSDDFIDSDGDGMDNYSEWKAGTNPTNSLSVFALNSAGISESGLKLQWNSLTGRTYRIEGGTNLLDSPAFRMIQSGIEGEASVTEYIDTNTLNSGASFYRIIIE